MAGHRPLVWSCLLLAGRQSSLCFPLVVLVLLVATVRGLSYCTTVRSSWPCTIWNVIPPMPCAAAIVSCSQETATILSAIVIEHSRRSRPADQSGCQARRPARLCSGCAPHENPHLREEAKSTRASGNFQVAVNYVRLFRPIT